MTEPFFPFIHEFSGRIRHCDGAEARDVFAAIAMHALLQDRSGLLAETPHHPSTVATRSVAMADALCLALKGVDP